MAMDGTYRVTFKFFSESTLEVSFSSLSDGDIESSIGNCVFVDPNITITCFDDDFFTGVVSGNQMILYYFGEDRMVFTSCLSESPSSSSYPHKLSSCGRQRHRNSSARHRLYIPLCSLDLSATWCGSSIRNS